MRDEMLNGEEFESLLEAARVVVNDWLVRHRRASGTAGSAW